MTDFGEGDAEDGCEVPTLPITFRWHGVVLDPRGPLEAFPSESIVMLRPEAPRSFDRSDMSAPKVVLIPTSAVGF